MVIQNTLYRREKNSFFLKIRFATAEITISLYTRAPIFEVPSKHNYHDLIEPIFMCVGTRGGGRTTCPPARASTVGRTETSTSDSSGNELPSSLHSSLVILSYVINYFNLFISYVVRKIVP